MNRKKAKGKAKAKRKRLKKGKDWHAWAWRGASGKYDPGLVFVTKPYWPTHRNGKIVRVKFVEVKREDL